LLSADLLNALLPVIERHPVIGHVSDPNLAIAVDALQVDKVVLALLPLLLR
jgi:hypothetical protein